MGPPDPWLTGFPCALSTFFLSSLSSLSTLNSIFHQYNIANTPNPLAFLFVHSQLTYSSPYIVDEAPAVIKIDRININNLRYANDTTLMAESEEELKSLLMKVKQESEKAGLKLNIQKMKIVASGPVTSWQVDGEQWKLLTHFIFLGSKSIVHDDCSHERHLLLGRKAMTNLDSILKKQRHYFANKGLSSQGYGFSCGLP